MNDYFSQPKLCDLPAPTEGALDFSAQSATQTLVKKLVIRRDDRDNAALGTQPTVIDKINVMDDRHIQIEASTTIPTGAVKKDAIGRTVQDSLVRVAKTKTGIQQVSGTDLPSLVSVWVSAPLDEWQKPVSGIKLQQVFESVVVQ